MRGRRFLRPNLVAGLAVVVFALAVAPAQALTSSTSRTVRTWVTTSDQTKLLARQADTTFGRARANAGISVNVDESQLFQQMDGFGASMTDSSVWLLYNRMTAGSEAQ